LQVVSDRCGFGSYKYFSDAFLKATGQRRVMLAFIR
jgi:AraC-like DNA-binding protein